MRTESRSKGSGSTKSKGGANKLAHKSLQSDGRSKAQKKADTKYYEANQEKIREKNRVRMQMRRAKQKKLESFEDLPPSDDEPSLSDASPRPLGKRKHATYPQVPGCPSDVDSATQVEVDQMSDDDYRDIFKPQNEDGYNDEGTNIRMPSPATHSQTPPVDATILAGIQTLREVRMATNQWVSSLGPLESWPRVFQEYYEAACQRNAGRSTQEGVDGFLETVERHVDNGRSILKRLRESPIVSPPPLHEAWGDFLGAGDLMETLYRGIAILEVRLDIFAPRGPSPLEGESSIRKWQGLVDRF